MPIDTEAEFTDVYRAHYEDVLRFVRRRAHPMNVDDIVGETFLAAWRRRRELPDDPRPWLFGTARKVMLNDSRGMRRHTALAVRVQQAAETGGRTLAADPAALVDGRTDLAAAWQALAPADQEVLALHVWEQLSAKDAAKVLGCTRAAYAMRLTRAKRRLAARIDRAAATAPALATTF
ncbi:sigma-70 family RNA polymerase sigma factor [Streptomyces phaeolivaceus]|uniref:Sigma-70 family RNA polymerase sigma factor n=1 Tax=Streptomyces phaeolivaceus TaxID=2653200 RepID=A0A5P8K8N0_9ACTN|nr:sigma-70 family RNA polymerase sigma factor [Streptomyces phaeolivaceus]QFQ98909.1 sigma-70 family RNA polymerase sigma factor [Streptomyces phaeolivaceus]